MLFWNGYLLFDKVCSHFHQASASGISNSNFNKSVNIWIQNGKLESGTVMWILTCQTHGLRVWGMHQPCALRSSTIAHV